MGRAVRRGRIRRRPRYPNHVWSYDFVADQNEDGRRLKIFVVVDEYTRRWHARRGTGTLHIQPGSPWENRYTESLLSKAGW